jgi:hypothetical protein
VTKLPTLGRVGILVGTLALLASCSSSRSGGDKPAPPPGDQATPRSSQLAPRRPEVPIVPVARVYVDAGRNVHAVQVDSQDVRVTYQGHYRDPQLSPDRRTVGMLTVDSLDDGTGHSVEVSTKLKLLRGVGFVQQVEPGGFIRSWSFARDGKAVAIYSGGLHFAGTYELYDAGTGALLDYAKDPVTETSPDWVRALSP